MFRLVVFCVFVAVINAQGHSHGHGHQDRVCQHVGHYDCGAEDKAPECGTDGVTYDNSCYYLRAHCKNSSIQIAHSGVCGTMNPSGDHQATGDQLKFEYFCRHLAIENCTAEVDYICASNGITYRNLCEFEKNMCVHVGLMIKSYGMCPSI